MLKTAKKTAAHALGRLVLLVLICSLPTATDAAQRDDQDAFLKRAVYAENRLWVLTDAGGVSSISEGQEKRTKEILPERAADLCATGGHPTVVTGGRMGGSAWTLRRHEAGAWSVVAAVPANGDKLLAMACTRDKATLLTSRRLIEFDGKQQSAVVLSDQLGLGPVLVASTYATPDQFFVGLNAGEWGGGLLRIDRSSGKIGIVEKNTSGELCGGPLNTSCDPVNGIVAEPGKPGCIAAAIGLVHMAPHGRVVEVCGDEVQRIFYKPYGKNEPRANGRNEEPFSTVAFFRLASDGETMQAVGIDGIYSLDGKGTEQFTPLPHFKDIGGIGVSFDIPHYVLVLTNINQRMSMSGAVPLMVPR